MSRNSFTIKKGKVALINQEELVAWFMSKDFHPVDFEDGKFETVVHTIGTSIYHNLKKNQGYTTFSKPAFGGSLLVFETKLTKFELVCQCYSPMLLFGFKRIELDFQKKPSWITKYRKEGFLVMEELKEIVSSNS